MRRLLLKAQTFLSGVLLLVGCSPLQLANNLVRKELRVEADIAYGPYERQTLDVYTSPQTESGSGVVIFVHGGYWDSGDKADYRFIADSFAEKGFVTVIPNFRLVPAVTFPSYVEDVALAVKWVFENHRSDAVFLMGHSSGAHIAALIAFDERYMDAVGLTNEDLAGFIGLAGPYDFLPPTSDRTRAALGAEEGWQVTQPIEFVDSSDPPAFLATGLADETVNPDNSKRLADRILESGGVVELRTYRGLSHGALVAALARAGRVLERAVLHDVIEFMRSFDQLSPPSR